MKAVMADVPEHVLEERRRSGADRWDEVWDGVLHMPPSPTYDHQDLESLAGDWLRRHWAPPSGGKAIPQINVSRPGIDRWLDDFRIPDIVLLTLERLAEINRNEFFEGGPEVVVEIRSPGDESLDKLTFYAEVGVREVWVIDRDTKVPRVFVVRDAVCEERAVRADGWLDSPFTGVWMKACDGKLHLRLADDPATEAALP